MLYCKPNFQLIISVYFNWWLIWLTSPFVIQFNNDMHMWVTSWVRGTVYNDSYHGHSCLGTCLNSSGVQYHYAESPAFDLEDYQSTMYSTWAESKWVMSFVYNLIVAHHKWWSAVQLRMYLTTSIEHQVTIVIVTNMMMCIQFVV